MNIAEYIEKTTFDRFRLYYREYDYSRYTLIDLVHTAELLDQFQSIENPILTKDGVINKTFRQIGASSNKEEITQVFGRHTEPVFPHMKNTVYTIALVLEHNSAIAGGVNIDTLNRTAKSIDNDILFLSDQNVEKLIALYKRHGCTISNAYRPPSIPVAENWRNYSFPNDFGFNPAFELFETCINSGLMCTNFVHARLEIWPVNGRITQRQIERVYEIERSKYQLNKYLQEHFWLSYNELKDDYGLPELTDKDQLKYFVKVSGFSIPPDESEPVTISFRTWDEEHGQTVYYYNEQKIGFE